MKKRLSRRSFLARGQGFEPRLPGPEPGVLPLDDPRRREEYSEPSPAGQS